MKCDCLVICILEFTFFPSMRFIGHSSLFWKYCCALVRTIDSSIENWIYYLTNIGNEKIFDCIWEFLCELLEIFCEKSKLVEFLIVLVLIFFCFDECAIYYNIYILYTAEGSSMMLQWYKFHFFEYLIALANRAIHGEWKRYKYTRHQFPDIETFCVCNIAVHPI